MAEFEIPALNGLPQQTAEAGAALAALREPAEQAARAIDESFAKAGGSLARSLGRAAADGKLSLGELAESVLRAVNAAAGVRAGGLAGGLGELFGAVVKTAFAGARADGGPVSPGGAYLVGERGPEVFRPAAGGEVSPAAGGLTVNVSVQGEAGGGTLLRSEAQIAQALARAVRLGGR